MNKKWYPSQVECATGVNVQYSKIMCVSAEGVNKANRTTCEKFDVTGKSDTGSSVAVVQLDNGTIVDRDVTVRIECTGVECGDHVA